MKNQVAQTGKPIACRQITGQTYPANPRFCSYSRRIFIEDAEFVTSAALRLFIEAHTKLFGLVYFATPHER